MRAEASARRCEGVISDHPLVDAIPQREVAVKDTVLIGGGEPSRFLGCVAGVCARMGGAGCDVEKALL
ncbi:MAG: hypothetical protein R3F11_05925 [Verrucomicrobiales bacterium]